MNEKDMRYVVTTEQLGGRKRYVYASSSLEKCRDYISRKYRNCRLMTRKTDKEDDESLVEKYVQVFKRTSTQKTIIIIRIMKIYLDDELKEAIDDDM